MSIDWEVIACLGILAVMLFVAFKGGRSNPMGTGDLEKKVYKDIHQIKNEMQALEGRFSNAATKLDIEEMRTEIAEAATERTKEAAKELGKIQKDVATVCAKVEGLEGTVDGVADGVKRIEGFFLKKGINGQ